MKIFFKFILLSSVILSTPDVFGQEMKIRAGLNISEITVFSRFSRSEILEPKTGFHVGITREFSTKKHLFETGLILTSKGNKVSDKYIHANGEDREYHSKHDLWYVEVPLTFKRYFEIEKVKMSVYYGPYIAFGLFGNLKGEMTRNGKKTKFNSSVWNREYSLYKRFDAGFTVGLGTEFNDLYFGLSTSLGLLKMNSARNEFQFNRALSLSVGYKFR